MSIEMYNETNRINEIINLLEYAAACEFDTGTNNPDLISVRAKLVNHGINANTESMHTLLSFYEGYLSGLNYFFTLKNKS